MKHYETLGDLLGECLTNGQRRDILDHLTRRHDRNVNEAMMQAERSPFMENEGRKDCVVIRHPTNARHIIDTTAREG